MAETTRVGITSDGKIVFSNGLDEIGRVVVQQATADTPGLLQDGITWTLIAEEKK